MTAPVNLKLGHPTEPVKGWVAQAEEWKQLNQEVGGNPKFSPLTIKAAYAIGVIHDLSESVQHLLTHPMVRQTTYLPAYGVFGAAVDLLGRCIRGNSSAFNGSTRDIKAGFSWLAGQAGDGDQAWEKLEKTHIVVETESGRYTVGKLAALRHFAAHGQATSKRQIDSVDYDILGKAHPLLRDGLERYWNCLLDSENLCNRLARANIIALRSWPVSKSWLLFQGGGSGDSITNIFNKFAWELK